MLEFYTDVHDVLILYSVVKDIIKLRMNAKYELISTFGQKQEYFFILWKVETSFNFVSAFTQNVKSQFIGLSKLDSPRFLKYESSWENGTRPMIRMSLSTM
jgi:hypothetical protein